MRDVKLMNRGWKFYFGEPEFLRIRAESSDQTYRGTRAANARGPARRDFDDSTWETVHLPHDFVALNGISETDAHGGEHFDFPMDRGSAWYRRYFMLGEEARDKRFPRAPTKTTTSSASTTRPCTSTHCTISTRTNPYSAPR